MDPAAVAVAGTASPRVCHGDGLHRVQIQPPDRLTTATEVFESAIAKTPSSGIGQREAQWQAVYEFAESAESENYLGTRSWILCVVDMAKLVEEEGVASDGFGPGGGPTSIWFHRGVVDPTGASASAGTPHRLLLDGLLVGLPVWRLPTWWSTARVCGVPLDFEQGRLGHARGIIPVPGANMSNFDLASRLATRATVDVYWQVRGLVADKYGECAATNLFQADRHDPCW
ncbi:MAG: hypothetical protein QOD59_401 [Mycobacterium sp.]|nr:hypothetical protein [Mycobacterium sp.]